MHVLTANDPPRLIQFFAKAPGSVDVPGLGTFQTPGGTWASNDGVYHLSQVEPFACPDGFEQFGEPSYEISGDGSTVHEVYGTRPLVPEKPPFQPRAVVAALKAWGVEDAVMSKTSTIDLLDFELARAIPRDEPRLLAILKAVGKTVDDLDAEIQGASA